MIRVNRNGLVYYRFEGLADEPDLSHAVFTRLGGVSRSPFATLNLGHTVGDDLEAVRINHQRALAAVGWPREAVATAHQVHGNHVQVVGEGDRGTVQRATDGLVTDRPGVLLMLRFADCAPLLLYDRERRAVGLVHVGWRGLVAGAAPAALARMATAFGTRPADLWAGVGPAIGPCCYEVGPDVIESVRRLELDGPPVLREQPGGRVHLDLWSAIVGQLRAGGVEEIEVAGLCTACHTEEWYSHRAERGRTGRFGAVIGFRA
ncbi:MAG TPA: peptidoglycan editing factor PgeF [Chloroflexi bacterium]|nr:peptidoglycan editing factor PgeF [Chloroflexota bacterium]